jgi:glycine cleavage system H protein
MTVRYSREHQWIDSADHESAIVGITPHAQETLGDIVFVDLPEIGKIFKQGEIAAVVESVKTAADVFMPASGRIVEVNEALRDDPALANRDPMGQAWFFKVALSDTLELDALLDEPAYTQLTKDA